MCFIKITQSRMLLEIEKKFIIKILRESDIKLKHILLYMASKMWNKVPETIEMN